MRTLRLRVGVACCPALILLALAASCGSGGAGNPATQSDAWDAPSELVPQDSPLNADGPEVDGGSPGEVGGDVGGDVDDATSDGTAHPGCRDGGATQCGAPTACGPVVQPQYAPGQPPSAAGGAVSPGLYFLTSVSVYGGDAGAAPASLQIAIDFTSVDFSESDYEAGYEQSPISGSYSTTGSTIVRNVSCQTSATLTQQFTATTATLVLYRQEVAGLYLDTFQSQ